MAQFGVGLHDTGWDVLNLLPTPARFTSSTSPAAADLLAKSEPVAQPTGTAPHAAQAPVLWGPGARAQQHRPPPEGPSTPSLRLHTRSDQGSQTSFLAFG